MHNFGAESNASAKLIEVRATLDDVISDSGSFVNVYGARTEIIG